ncbi:MAG: CoA transferase [Burkholderiaceae bacterium]|nr:CoA transferase [Burkholderiaceae bacterium]
MSDDTQLPMAGVRVLDAATFLAAPFCASILAEFGADVIKIEHPVHDDPMRKMGTVSDNGDTLMWVSETRNKRAMTLNLSNPKGAALFKEMVQNVDVVVENFRPGTMERWGLGYKDLAAINPRIVMVRITAYGQDGPYKDRPGFARIAHGFGGLTYLAGEAGQRPVIPGSTSLGDYISGLYSTIGVMMALREAERSGKGQVVDMALYESVFRLLDEVVPAYARFGMVRERMGPDTAILVPHSHYECADGHWIALACSSDKMFARLAHVMGRDDLAASDAYASMPQSIEGRDKINAIVATWIRQHRRADLMKICAEAEVPCGPINSVADIFQDPHFAARKNLVRVQTDDAGEVTVPGVFPRLSRTPGHITHLGRRKSQDTSEILKELLNKSEADIAALKESGAI